MMAQHVGVLTGKSADLSSISRTHMVERNNSVFFLKEKKYESEAYELRLNPDIQQQPHLGPLRTPPCLTPCCF